MTIDAQQNRRLRGMILELLYGRHQAQLSRVDHVLLWHMLRDLGADIGENDALTTLQDLSDRGYLTYREEKNRFTNRTSIWMIQLTARGRDLAEQTFTDPAVQF